VSAATAVQKHLLRRLSGELASAASELARFQERFAQDPAHAFEWADAAVEAAAKVEVLGRARGFVEADDFEDKRGGWLAIHRNALLVGAKWPRHSTGQVSNLLDRFRLSATAQLVEMLVEAEVES
jgi:hypothetical protein